MTGELCSAWSRTWQEVWLRLARSSSAPDDLFVELVRGIAPLPRPPTSPPQPTATSYDSEGRLLDPRAIQALHDYETAVHEYNAYRNNYETALNSETTARVFFRQLLTNISNESEAIEFLESSYSTLAGFGPVALAKRFQALTRLFLINFNIRYELREPFSLHATMPGVFSKLVSEVKKVAESDSHLRDLLFEYEEAFADLKSARTQARIKTCLQKQFNFLEALGSKCPNVTETTLGAMCNQLDLPHATIKEIGRKLYGFGSNYPGLRHAGNSSSALRQLNMKDFVSLSLMLASFTPYVTHGLSSDRCYSG